MHTLCHTPFILIYSTVYVYPVYGLQVGSAQAFSRSLFCDMIPSSYEGAFFSLYAIANTSTSWLGPLCFSLVHQWTDSYRTAFCSLAAFFLVGMCLLLCINVQKAHKDAQNFDSR